MAANANFVGKWARNGLLALGLGIVAVPLSGVLAQDEPAAAEAETEALTAEQIESSRALFNQYSCGACHVLADAGGNGHIGPALDGNAALSTDYVKQILNNGQGAMPSFGGMMDAEQLDTLSAYIVQVKQ